MFTEPGLKELLNELHTVRANWYSIGLQLDIPHTTMDCLKQNHSDPSDLMREVLKYWLDTAVDPRPSWEAVVAALRSPVVDKKCIAEKLESMYCASVQHVKESNGFTKMEKSAGIVFSLRTYFQN